MAEINVTPQHSASYIGNPSEKKVELSVARPYICASYIGASTTATVNTYEGTISGTVESTTNIIQLTPSVYSSYVGNAIEKKVEVNIAVPYICASYIPSALNEVVVDFDLSRNVANVVTVNHDTTRTVTAPQILSLSTARNVNCSVELSIDTQNNISNVVTLDLDIARTIYNIATLNENFDLLRNVIAPQTLSVDTTRNIVKSTTLAADIVRDIYQSWRYEDYGTGKLLEGEPSNNTWQAFSAHVSKSKFECGFWSYNSYFSFPSTNEVWLKFDVFADNNFTISSRNGEYRLNVDILNNEISIVCLYDYYEYDDGTGAYDSYDSDSVEYTWQTDVLHTCLFHLKSGAEYQGLAELWIDGEKVIELVSGFYDGKSFSKLYLTRDTRADSGDTYVFSNVIISDSEIGFDEDCSKDTPLTRCESKK